MTWSKGQPWRVAGSLQTLNTQMLRRYPRAAPPATPASAWGSIADDAHSTTSDHYPHDYPALGPVATVCARDFPHAASLGMDAGVITEALRQSRDRRIAYVIFAGRIFSSTTQPWVWRKYTGSDGHWTHFHISVVHGEIANDTRPWVLPGVTAGSTSGDDMQVSDPSPFITQFSEPDKDYALWFGGTVGNQLQWLREDAHFARLFAKRAAAESTALRAVVESLAAALSAGGGSVDTAAILAGVDERLAKLAAEQRDAVADLGEGGAAQVRADAD